MEKKTVVWYFSCSGNGRKIAEKIHSLFPDGQADLTDITSPKVRDEISKSCNYPFLIIIFPIFAGDAPVPLIEFFQSLKGNHTTVCLIALYGEIHTGKALFNAADVLQERGFTVVSGAEIVTPHSYNNEHVKIGLNRPNSEELGELFSLIQHSAGKREGIIFPVEKESLKTKLMIGLPQNTVRRAATQLTYNRESCSKCGLCVKKCPVGAIRADFITDSKKCIRCLACVYCCPRGAKQFRFRSPVFERFLISNANDNKSSFYI